MFALVAVGAIFLALLISTGLVVVGSRTLWKDSSSKVLQIFSILISSLAILVALICLGGATIWQGPSGEWANLALIPSFLFNLPPALIALVIGLVVRGGTSK